MARKKKRVSRKWVYGNRIIIPRRQTSELNRLAEIPYKAVDLLNNYPSERRRIVPRHVPGNPARRQRKLTAAIKRARNIALLSFSEGYVAQDGAAGSGRG